MTQPSYGGTAGTASPGTAPHGPNVAASSAPTTEFGAPTISGPAQGTQHGAPQGPPAQGPSAPGRSAPTPPRGSARPSRNRGPRRARLQLRHISPLTVLKFSCVLAIALFFVWLIVVGVLYGILDAAGAISHVNDLVTQLRGSGSKAPITAGIVFGGAAIIGVVNIVLFVALTTIGSVIYNLCADLVGGIEITLSER